MPRAPKRKMASPQSKEESLLLLPWLIDHLERETFEGLRWSDKDNKIFYVYWMHKAADPWTRKQVEVCEAWAKYKGNKKENPRDIKANFRCALRSKKELKLVQKTKDRLFWKIIDAGTGTEADTSNSKRSAPTSSSSSSSSDEGIATFGSNEVCRSSKKRKYTKASVSRPKQSRRGRKKSIEKEVTLSFSEIRTDHDSSASSSPMSTSIPVSNENIDHRLTPFQAIPLIPEIQRISPFCAMLPSTDIQPASPISDIQRMSPAQVIPSIADRTSPFQTIPSVHELQEISCVEQQASPFLDEQRIMSPRISPLPNSDVQTMMDFQSPPSICSTINLEQLSTITSSSYLLAEEQRPGKLLPSFTTFNHQNRLAPPKQSTDISAYGEDLTLQEERYSWKSTTDASQFYQNAKQQDRRLPFVYMSNSPSANEEQLVPSTSPMNLNLYFDNNNFHSPAKNFQENQLYSPIYEPHFEVLSESPLPSQDSQYVENSDAILEEFYNFSSLFTEYIDS